MTTYWLYSKQEVAPTKGNTTLTFQDTDPAATTQGGMGGPLMGGGGAGTYTKVVPNAEAATFVVGNAYEVTVSPMADPV